MGSIFDIVARGAVAGNSSVAAMWQNGAIINATLAALQPHDTMLVPDGIFHTFGGLYAMGLQDATIQIDGTLRFAGGEHRKEWPRDARGHVMECLNIEHSDGLTFTSSGAGGTLDGNGEAWWGAIQYLVHEEDRPRLLKIHNASNILVEKLLFKQPPYWTTLFDDVDGVTIRHSNISVHRTNATTHDIVELQAFNTDGFDVAGRNVHIHDVQIWNDDDSVCVKPMSGGGHRATCSENWLVERVNASGVGLTLGSISPSRQVNCMRNITFRDSLMVNTWKGIYIKTLTSDDPQSSGVIEDILYENITMASPTGWPIWIGPAAQAEGGNTCLFWPRLPGSKCPTEPKMTLRNIVLRDIRIDTPKGSPGVVMGNASNPIDVTFDGVVVTNPGADPWGDAYYSCWGANGTATGGTWPVPPCFNGGRQCLADCVCVDAAGTPCCSGAEHFTLECPLAAGGKRCGSAS